MHATTLADYIGIAVLTLGALAIGVSARRDRAGRRDRDQERVAGRRLPERRDDGRAADLYVPLTCIRLRRYVAALGCARAATPSTSSAIRLPTAAIP